MGVQGYQVFRPLGTTFLFRRDAISGIEQPYRDIGVITEDKPNIEAKPIQVNDPRSGVIKLIEETVVEINESYEITTQNLNLNNLAMAYLADPVEGLTQTPTADSIADAEHYAHPGELVQIHDAAGEPMLGLASVDAVTQNNTAQTPYVLDTDYEIVDLEAGLIRMMPGGAFAAAATILITATVRAISGLRRIHPQSLVGTLTGDGILIFGQGNNARRMRRRFRASITPNGFNLKTDDYSDIGLKIAVLNDLTQDIPAGVLDEWVGALPTAS